MVHRTKAILAIICQDQIAAEADVPGLTLSQTSAAYLDFLLRNVLALSVRMLLVEHNCTIATVNAAGILHRD
jgi:hypothetical protein